MDIGVGACAGITLGENQDMYQVEATVGTGAGTALGAILCLPVTIELLYLTNVSDTSI